jgi:NAD-reducing hydrogenase large subunit
MVRKIIIDPVTRIEGHAKITLVLGDDGRVSEARFHVTEFRGFEKFCEGRSFREMPAITSRICGICPVSHLLCSAKTGDGLLAVTPPPTAVLLRRIMNLGQIIQSHALSFFHLSGPDLFLGFGADPHERNIFGLIRSHPELARDGIRLRQFGQRVIERLGGRRIHTAWAIPGGVTDPLSEDDRQTLRSELSEADAIVTRTLAMFKALLPQMQGEIESFGEFPSLFLSLVTPEGHWEHHEGLVRVGDSAGNIRATFAASDYGRYLGEAVEPWSYLKFPFFKEAGYPEGAYRVGPLARLNLCRQIGTPRADAELIEFRQRYGPVVTSSFHYHYARLIEIMAATEWIAIHLDDPRVTGRRVHADADLNATEAVGVSEAPRGTLFHHYIVDDTGLLTRVNLLIATGQNNLPMQRTIQQIANRYVHGPELTDEMLNRLEAGIRAFDPCLSCSTHAAGEMPLYVELIGPDGTRIAEKRRGERR